MNVSFSTLRRATFATESGSRDEPSSSVRTRKSRTSAVNLLDASRFALHWKRTEAAGFFYKHYGARGLLTLRWIYLLNFTLRYCGYRLLSVFRNSDALTNRLNMYKVSIKWHIQIDPSRFIETGEEPNLGYEPLAPAPKMTHEITYPTTR